MCKEIWETFSKPLGLEWEVCKDCLACDLMPENVLAWEIYARCGTQVIVSGGLAGQVLGINVLAVYRVMESFQVPTEEEISLLDKILSLHSTYFPMKEGSDGTRRPKQ